MTPGTFSVLLVEDNPADARLVERYLREVPPDVNYELERVDPGTTISPDELQRLTADLQRVQTERAEISAQRLVRGRYGAIARRPYQWFQ